MLRFSSTAASVLGTLLTLAGTGVGTPASAREICGWYVIAYCSTDREAVSTFANNGWGAVINTNNFAGFARNKFCAVSGPQSKASAQQDRDYAVGNGVVADAYIKRACADQRFIGD